jgi:hypothetical protein
MTLAYRVACVGTSLAPGGTPSRNWIRSFQYVDARTPDGGRITCLVVNGVIVTLQLAYKDREFRVA